jgi:hypothetical protein
MLEVGATGIEEEEEAGGRGGDDSSHAWVFKKESFCGTIIYI